MLERPRPIVPKRVIFSPSKLLWFESSGGPSLVDALSRWEDRGDLDGLAKALSRSIVAEPGAASPKHYAVGTDGELPEEVGEDWGARLKAALSTIADQVTDAAMKGRPQKNNDAIRALTWSFTLCPERVQDILLSAFAGDELAHRSLLQAPYARRAAVRGLGRTVNSRDRMEKALHQLCSMPQNADTRGAIADILFRRAHAPEVLEEELSTQVLDCALSGLAKSLKLQNFKLEFRWSLCICAGLLRRRELEPHIFVCGSSPGADAAHDLIVRAISQMRATRSWGSSKLIDLCEKVAKAFEGEGTPNILSELDAVTESDPA
jgi:hypothetical protein